ncbi:MAG: cyclase family protein [Proteobacteria bacterium]|nr:cyclase family protein [Pseudomonadota bacterium]
MLNGFQLVNAHIYCATRFAYEIINPHGSVMTHGLWQQLDLLRSGRFVDLTHAFEAGIPHAPGMPDEERVTLYDIEQGKGTLGAGFLTHQYRHVGQWGTHVDPPAHFVRGGRFLDEIPVSDMLLPLVAFDVRQGVAANHDYELDLSDVRAWEQRHGRMPPRAFAVMQTGWSSRWPSAAAMRNADVNGVARFPGWSIETLRFLIEERDACAFGHETTDTDAGVKVSADEYPAERYLLEQDRYQIELLADLSCVPAAGAVAVVSFPKPRRGSGFPARVFAICPSDADAL